MNTPAQNVYEGIITQVIVVPGDPRYHVGQIFTGRYQYVSGSPDGTFYPNTSVNPTGNKSLTGTVFLAFPDPLGRFNDLPDTRNPSHLTVTGGVVSAFDWTWESGDYFTYFNLGTFFARVAHRQPDTTGTVSFSVPTLKS